MTALGAEDVVLRPGLLSHERELVRQLWLPPVALEVVGRWSTGSVASLRFRPNDNSSPDFTYPTVRGALLQSEGFVCLEVGGHDAGVLHEVAERALADGVRSVVFEGDGFTGDAPFFAFTERVPGQPTKPLWFDPLRGLDDSNAIDALLHAYGLSLERLVQYTPSLHISDSFGFVEWMREGRRLEPPRWRASSSSADETSLIERISWTLALLLLAPIAIGFPYFFASMTSAPLSLETVLMPGVVSLVLVSWLALIPFRWPTGARMSRRVRLLWFLGLPAVLPVLLMLVRSR